MTSESRVAGSIDLRTWDGARVDTSRHRKRLAPSVLGLCLVMIIAGLLSAFAPSATATSPEPSPACAGSPAASSDLPGPQPACGGGGGGCTSYPAVGITIGSTTNDATNFSIAWTESPDVPTTIYWWNSSEQEISQAITDNGGTYSAFINFLEPSTTYTYEITANPISGTCYSVGTHTASWTSQSESVYYGSHGYTFYGQVTDASTGSPAPAYIAVEAWCLKNPAPTGGWFGYGYTNSEGQYSFSVYNPGTGEGYCQSYGSGAAGAYVVVFGEANFWYSHWNETVVVWAPQAVNFQIPQVYASPYIPEVLDFDNAPDDYGSVSFQAEFSTTTTLEHDWSVSGGVIAGGGSSGSTAVSQTTQSGSGPYTDSGTLDWGAEYKITTGMVMFNAIYRTWNITSLSLTQLSSDGFSSQFGVSAPAEPGTLPTGAYYLLDSNGAPFENRYTPADGGYTGEVQTSTTVAVAYGSSISFSLSVPLPGAQSASFNVQTGWTQTSSTSAGWDLYWSIGGPTAACYDVWGEGGNPNSYPVTDADLIGIYYFAPTNGAC